MRLIWLPFYLEIGSFHWFVLLEYFIHISCINGIKQRKNWRRSVAPFFWVLNYDFQHMFKLFHSLFFFPNALEAIICLVLFKIRCIQYQIDEIVVVIHFQLWDMNSFRFDSTLIALPALNILIEIWNNKRFIVTAGEISDDLFKKSLCKLYPLNLWKLFQMSAYLLFFFITLLCNCSATQKVILL